MDIKHKFPAALNLQRYNGNNNAGVVAFETGPDFIILKFRHKSSEGRQTYLYNYEIPGKIHVEAMKKRAMGGEGLTTYKNHHLPRAGYAAYWDEKLKTFIPN